ncbi:hypothetical protein [Methylobacterium trifolii]|uniref:DUF4169 family protein n=1 Tax=Methylobacterium trifolii TaxID=1003092 RepID=A0ABQ4TV26_9HYPH|nr:hypothetical protein [Methylobacterium trifolii]GJE58916.1 hypothetical protein MPOCJGCO_1001 [Methylobacterium trifolii]
MGRAKPMTDSEKDRRTERLKAALRDNLRRRKAQGRGRAEDAAVTDGTPADATSNGAAPDRTPSEKP